MLVLKSSPSLCRSEECMNVSESESHSVVSDSLPPHGICSPWSSPGQNTAVGSRSLLQDIFPTQGSNQGLPHCRQILYQLSQKESPRILEWVAYPFSSRFSWPRNQTGVSCIAGRFFTNWAIREAPIWGKVTEADVNSLQSDYSPDISNSGLGGWVNVSEYSTKFNMQANHSLCIKPAP